MRTRMSVALPLLLAGLLMAATSARPKELTVVKMATNPASVNGILTQIAIEKGFFIEQGIEPEMITITDASVALQSLSAGHIHLGRGGLAAALFNAAARGIPLKVVADAGNFCPGHGTTILMARRDLYDSGALRTPADLKGRKVAVNVRGAVDHRFLLMALATAGLTEKEIDLTTMPHADMLPAFGNKALDAGFVLEPSAVRAELAGLAVRWIGADKIEPCSQVLAVIYNGTWAERQPQAARGFMVAYLKSVRYYTENFLRRKNRSEIINMWMKYSPLKDPAAYDRMVPPSFNIDGNVDKESVARFQDWYFDRGVVKQKADINRLVDNQFVNHALSLLGKGR